MVDLAAAERGAESVRQARIQRVQRALAVGINDQADYGGQFCFSAADGETVELRGIFSLRELAEAVDKVI